MAERYKVLAELGQALGRRFSTAVVMFHQALAERFGMNATDFKCGDIISRYGPMTAGELSRLTGIDTGTLTTVIDRLERAGFARRERDPKDRRKVIVEPVHGRDEELNRLLGGMAPAMERLTAGYSSEELSRIAEFMTGLVEVVEEETRNLRAQASQESKKAKAED